MHWSGAWVTSTQTIGRSCSQNSELAPAAVPRAHIERGDIISKFAGIHGARLVRAHRRASGEYNGVVVRFAHLVPHGRRAAL
jgi:hypothetical protein